MLIVMGAAISTERELDRCKFYSGVFWLWCVIVVRCRGVELVRCVEYSFV